MKLNQVENVTRASIEKIRKTRRQFKPDIRVATALIGAIDFLHKVGLKASTQMIKKCIRERTRKGFLKGIEQLPLYINKGLELGILKKRRKSYSLGDITLRRKNKKNVRSKKDYKEIKILKKPPIYHNNDSEKSSENTDHTKM